MTQRAGYVAIVLVLALGMVRPAAAIDLGHADLFNEGVEGWTEGTFSPNPPTRVATGGAVDNGAYLQNVSAGFGLAGSRQAMFNVAQWTGDYLTAGVKRIGVDLLNAGATDLSVRIALGKGDNPQTATWYVSADPFVLAVGAAGWQAAEFDLTEDALTLVNGVAPLEEVLASVDELRILSATVPSFQGDSIAAILAVDNIRADVPEPASVILAVVGLLVLGAGPRHRRAVSSSWADR